MNPLERLKNKLRLKPTIEPQQEVNIIIPIANKPEKIELDKMTIVDKRTQGYDIENLRKKLDEKKLKKVIMTPYLEKEKIVEPIELPIPKKKVAKSLKKKQILEEDKEGEEIERGEEIVRDKEGEIEVELEIERKDKEGKEGKEDREEKKGRRTKKVLKGVAILEPDDWINIENIQTIDRLPKKTPNVIYKVSSYYMNNREIFIDFINSLFEPYRNLILDDSQQISCDTIGNSSEEQSSLLTHQKIVRDYLNLFTPYRGLLLYHGLGSGKTFSSIAIAEGMKSSKKVIVMTPASLRRNYIEELKKFGDAFYKKTQYWEWISIKQYPEALETLSNILNLSVEYIKRKGGAWFVNVQKQNNYDELTSSQRIDLDDQLDEMIQTKYKFINYNGLRREKLKEMSNNFLLMPSGLFLSKIISIFKFIVLIIYFA